MKALSLRQPWAQAVTRGLKDIKTGAFVWKRVENRTWGTAYRGPLLVHASKRYDYEGAAWIHLRFPHLEVPTEAEFRHREELGALVGAVNVVEVFRGPEPAGPGWREWYFGPVGWLLRDPHWMLPPAPLRGHLGLFDVEAPGDTRWFELFFTLVDLWRERFGPHAERPQVF